MQQTQQALSRQNGTKRMRVRRRALSPAVMTVFSLVGAALVVASNSAVTPLYRLYQQSMHLTPLMITLVYAVYTFSLLAALLTVGGLSDYVGRRPAIAMVLFSYATDVGQLFLARAVQGLCVGTATPVLGAAILDTDHRRGPLLNSVTAFLGLTAGALGAATLVTFARDPLHLVYEVLFALTRGIDQRAFEQPLSALCARPLVRTRGEEPVAGRSPAGALYR